MCGLALVLAMTPVLANPADVEGTWLSADGDGLIEISVVGEELRGTILGSPNDDPEREKYDVHNPDPGLRGRKLVGLEIITGFRYDGDGKWSGGQIYDPNSGKTYQGKIRLVERDKLHLRGFIGISLIGRTEIWTRQP